MVIKVIGVIVAVIVIVVAIAAVGTWRGFIPVPGPLLALLVGAKEPEYSARYYPPDTLAYAWVTLTPMGGQFEDMRGIWERFNEFRDFRNLIDELRDDFEDETGIDFETEVMPWVGPDASAAFIDFNMRDDEPIAAATISVRDDDAARDFLEQWLEYMEDEEGADFDGDSYKGFKIWADESEYQVYGLSKGFLVFATTESGLREVVDGIAGDTDRSLADSQDFKAARTALSERRFASVYVNYREALDLIEDLDIDEIGFTGIGTMDGQEPEWIAASAAWFDRAVTVETVMPLGIDYPLEVVNLDDPASLLPADTLGFMAGAFDPDVDHWRTALAEYPLTEVLPYPELLDEINAGLAEMAPGGGPALADDATLADALDLGFDLAKDFTGIDLETDFFDHLSGQAILAVSDFDFDAVANDPAANAIDAVMMLSYRENGKDGLSDTMDEVAGLLEEDAGLEANSVDVGADDDATVFGLGFLGMMAGGKIGYQPGYVLHDEYLTIGTTEDALATIVARQNGDGDSLSSDDEYRRATSHLDNGRQFLAYVDVQSIIGNLEADDLDLERGQYRILDEGLGVAAFSAGAGEHYSRGVAVLTLFPE